MDYSLVLAAVLATSSPELPIDRETELWAEAIRPQLTAVAIGAEVVDAKEGSVGLAVIRDRFRQYGSMPTLADCNRFPPRALLNEWLAENRKYRQELLTRLAIDRVHEHELRGAIEECDTLYAMHDALRDASCEYYYVTVRRESLDRVRRLIGERAYYAGALPPPIPIPNIPRQ